MQEFISEDDLQTFEGWLRYQAIDTRTQTAEELAWWRGVFEEGRQRSATHPKVGLMKLGPLTPGEHRYAVAVREGSALWLTLWVRRSPKGEFFIMKPGGSDWDLHSSYHLDGRFHTKKGGAWSSNPGSGSP